MGNLDRLPMPTRASSCTGKQRFTRVEARRLARKRSEEYNERQHAYPCRFCRHWHIGHNWAFAAPKGRRGGKR